MAASRRRLLARVADGLALAPSGWDMVAGREIRAGRGPGGAPAGWAESAQETPAAVSSRAWLVTAQRVQGNGRASLRKSEME